MTTYALASFTVTANIEHIVRTMMDPNATPESFYTALEDPDDATFARFQTLQQNITDTQCESHKHRETYPVIRLTHLSPQMSLQRLLQQLAHLLLLIPHLLSQFQPQLTHLELKQQLHNMQLPTPPMKHYEESKSH